VRTNTCPASARTRQDPIMTDQHVLDLPRPDQVGGIETVFVNAPHTAGWQTRTRSVGGSLIFWALTYV
jgi:hypothetical protein